MQLLKTKSNGDRRFVDLYLYPDGTLETFLMFFEKTDPDGINHYVPAKNEAGDHFDEYVDIMMKGDDNASSTQEPSAQGSTQDRIDEA